MAKGAYSKQEVLKQLKSFFPDGFAYNDGKEFRINMTEQGEQVQVKLAITVALKPVESGEDVALPGTASSPTPVTSAPQETPAAAAQPTDEEKKNVAELLKKLNLF